MSEPKPTPTTYWDYIKVEELLSLQAGLEQDDTNLANDEVMFIVVHQVDELWFKLAIRELVALRDLFAADHVREQSLSTAVRGLRRAALVFNLASSHFALMETLTTRDYLAFRDKLTSASGFQSAQLREIEIVMGLHERERIPLGHESYFDALKYQDGRDSPASLRVAARLQDPPSLRDAVHGWLHRTPIDGSTPSDDGDAAHVASFVERFLDAHASEVRSRGERAKREALTPSDVERLAARFEREIEGARAYMLASDVDESERAYVARVRAALVFIESYRELPLLAWPREVLDAIVALEQAFTIFRQRHARMVERVIGRRTGTGGSAGVEYLDRTALEYRIFRDVWGVRTILVREGALPALARRDVYGFAEQRE